MRKAAERGTWATVGPGDKVVPLGSCAGRSKAITS